jgi:heme/copper-type cytochrome/quinol oxidase subunit 2
MRWKDGIREGMALTVLLLIFVGLPWAIRAYENGRVRRLSDGRPVFTLYANATGGTWTTTPLVGWTYFWRKPEPAHIRVPAGQPFVLRITSVDVHHSFGIPQLGIGPYDVEPGRFLELELKIDEPGLYTFMCYTVCGRHHETMMGTLEVTEVGGAVRQ